MRYQEALEEFQTIATIDSIMSAVTCAMRLGDYGRALDIVQSHENLLKDKTSGDTRDILFVMDTLRGTSNQDQRTKSTTNINSPIGIWLTAVDRNQSVSNPLPLETMIKFNIGPFDDPSLIHLDDKVMLHELLTASDDQAKSFWPMGFILPDEVKKFQEHVVDTVMMTNSTSTITTTSSLWMRKERSGYGSHGNEVWTASEAVNRSSILSDKVLLQKLIDPFLIKGRVFSLRIYVIYFIDDDENDSIYVSPDGLVKLAALPFDSQGEDRSSASTPIGRRRIMTNSGREAEAEQFEFNQLEPFLNQVGFSLLDVRADIENSVQRVMQLYRRQMSVQSRTNASMSVTRKKLAPLKFPKILGFDFLLDRKDGKPWLIEVNRFPGLEARNQQDARVKEKVLRQAWQLAALQRRRQDNL